MKNNDDRAQFPTPGEIRIMRTLPGPIERVWTYLTDPAKRAKWFAGGPMELRAGGKRLAAKVERHNMPLGSVVLTCNDKLLVSSHKKGTAPPTQLMKADGSAFIQSDEYEGWGEIVTYDGRIMTLQGAGNTLARIRSRFKGDSQDGKTIIYDRRTNAYQTDGSFGGTISSPPPPPKK